MCKRIGEKDNFVIDCGIDIRPRFAVHFVVLYPQTYYYHYVCIFFCQIYRQLCRVWFFLILVFILFKNSSIELISLDRDILCELHRSLYLCDSKKLCIYLILYSCHLGRLHRSLKSTLLGPFATVLSKKKFLVLFFRLIVHFSLSFRAILWRLYSNLSLIIFFITLDFRLIGARLCELLLANHTIAHLCPRWTKFRGLKKCFTSDSDGRDIDISPCLIDGT